MSVHKDSRVHAPHSYGSYDTVIFPPQFPGVIDHYAKPAQLPGVQPEAQQVRPWMTAIVAEPTVLNGVHAEVVALPQKDPALARYIGDLTLSASELAAIAPPWGERMHISRQNRIFHIERDEPQPPQGEY